MYCIIKIGRGVSGVVVALVFRYRSPLVGVV